MTDIQFETPGDVQDVVQTMDGATEVTEAPALPSGPVDIASMDLAARAALVKQIAEFNKDERAKRRAERGQAERTARYDLEQSRELLGAVIEHLTKHTDLIHPEKAAVPFYRYNGQVSTTDKDGNPVTLNVTVMAKPAQKRGRRGSGSVNSEASANGASEAPAGPELLPVEPPTFVGG